MLLCKWVGVSLLPLHWCTALHLSQYRNFDNSFWEEGEATMYTRTAGAPVANLSGWEVKVPPMLTGCRSYSSVAFITLCSFFYVHSQFLFFCWFNKTRHSFNFHVHLKTGFVSPLVQRERERGGTFSLSLSISLSLSHFGLLLFRTASLRSSIGN